MKLPHYVILALLLVIGLMWFFWPSNKPDYSAHENRIKLREQAVHELQVENTKLLARIKSDSVSHKIEIQTYKDRDKIKSREIARIKANPVIVKVREEVKEVDSLIVAYDSLLESKDSQIYISEKYISNLQQDIGKVTSNFVERLALQDSTIQDQKSIIEDQRKTIRKDRRQKRLAKVVAVGAAIGGFLLGSAL